MSGIGRWPAAECVVLVAWLSGPAVYAVAWEPDGVDIDEGQKGDTDGDEDAGSAEVVGDCGGYRECEEGFQESARQGFIGIEAAEADVSDCE